jgi:hypothetical protein
MDIMEFLALFMGVAFLVMSFIAMQLSEKNKILLAENTRVWMKMNEANATVIQLRTRLKEKI